MSRPDDRKLQDLRRVLDIGRAMVATEDLDSLLGLIVDRSMELLDAERATVWLYRPEDNELISRVAAGEDVIRSPADKGIAGAAIQENATVNVPDAYADERFNPAVDRQTGWRTRNILSVPLHDYEGGLVGVLQVLNRRAGAFGDYQVDLAESLAAQAGVVLQRATLIEHYLEKQEMERAMKIAQDIQRGLLPERAPEVDGFDIAGFSEPADETGGDAYDFMALGEQRWTLTVADATGHGIGPALVIAETRAMLRAVSRQTPEIPAVLRIVNNLLNEDLVDARFVTCFFGVLDAAAATVAYASAGHGPMLFYHRAEDSFAESAATSLPLGILEDTDYDETVVHHFRPGDFLVITTDGFFEAADPDGELFGTERMQDRLRIRRDLPADRMIEDLRAAVADFTKGQPQADDLTAVIVKRHLDA